MTALRHAMCVYEDDADLHALLARTTLDALCDGSTVALELRPVSEVVLRREVAGQLGADAVAGLLRLQREPGPDGPSGQDHAVRIARLLRERHARTDRPITVVAEYCERFDDPGGAYRGEIEAAVEVALADLPALLLCFFPRHIPDAVAGVVRAAHPLELRDGVLLDRGGASGPRSLLAGGPSRAPAELGPPVRTLTFDASRLHEVRTAVDDALRGQGFPERRAEDVTLAVNEVATTTVISGSGTARLMLWTPPDDVVAEVHGDGELEHPLPGLAPPDPRTTDEHGIWIARQLCGLLHVWSDDEGTHVRVRAREYF